MLRPVLQLWGSGGNLSNPCPFHGASRLWCKRRRRAYGHLMAEHLTSCHKGKQRPGSTSCGSRRQGNKTLPGWQSVPAARFVHTVTAASSREDPWEHERMCCFVIWLVVSCQLTEQHNELEDEVAKGLSGNVDTMELFCLHCVSWKGNNGLFTANCLGGKRCHTWYCWSEDNK